MRGPARTEQIFSRLAEQHPDPKSDLEYRDSFTLLVAVVLSAQATDRSVNLATRTLFAEASDPVAMAALGEEGIRAHIRSIGLFNSKARNVAALSRILLDQYGGEVPDDFDALCRLPGVGEKTARVVLNIAFGHPVVAVDTHIFRLSHRLALASGKTPDAVSVELERKIPARWLKQAHHLLILHGRYVCRARKPDCGACVLGALCDWPGRTDRS